jgi:hypothetical protein
MYPGAMAFTLTPLAAQPFEKALICKNIRVVLAYCIDTHNTLHAMLCGGVSYDIETTLESDQTGDVDDLAISPWIARLWDRLSSNTTPGLEHVMTCVSSDREHGGEVDLEDLLPIRVWEVLHWVSPLNTTCSIVSDLYQTETKLRPSQWLLDVDPYSPQFTTMSNVLPISPITLGTSFATSSLLAKSQTTMSALPPLPS